MSKKQLDREIQSITKQLIDKYQPEKIILFGSAARDQFTEGSDLDFLLIKADIPEFGYQRMYQVRKMLKKSVPADFVIYKPEEFQKLVVTNEPFIATILKEGKILYEQ